MRDLWIAVPAHIADSDDVWNLVDALGISEDTAIACLVRFWGGVGSQALGGNLRGKSDAQLERWAGWRGEPGLFAKYIRQECLSDGVLKDWEDRHGKLEARKRADRDRKRGGQSPETPPPSSGGSAETPPDSAPTLPNRETSTTTTKRAREPVDFARQQERDIIARFDFDSAMMMRDFLDELAGDPRRGAVIGWLGMVTTGHGMPPAAKATPAEIAAAIAAFRIKHPDPTARLPEHYSERYLRSFIVDIVRRRSLPPRSDSGGGTNGAPRRSAPEPARYPEIEAAT